MLQLNNISKIFHQGATDIVHALSDVSLHVEERDFITVIGSNGAGKSTLLNIIAGTEFPNKGNILFQNKEVTSFPEYKRAQFIGRVFQNPVLGTAANMSIEDNMTLSMRKGRKKLTISLDSKRRTEFARLLASLEMGLEHRMKENTGLLSGGQRQALTLLMMVQSNPKLVLLDEHTAALDPANAEKILALTLEYIKEKSLTTIMITHNMHQAIQLGNRLVVMDRGKIIADFSGKKKNTLTVSVLIDMFSHMRNTGFMPDELLLS